MESTNMINVLLNHGSFAVYLIAFTAVALVAVAAERLATLFLKLSHNTEEALKDVEQCITERRYSEAIQLCNALKGAPNLVVVKSGLVAAESGREAMKSSISTAVLGISQKCEKRISYLSLIANVATLLGLLGTIMGLIKTFASIAQVDPTKKAELLGLGISEAMYATAAGLFVGITAMVIHTLCLSKADDIVASAQDTGLRLITWIEQSERGTGHDRRVA